MVLEADVPFAFDGAYCSDLLVRGRAEERLGGVNGHAVVDAP